MGTCKCAHKGVVWVLEMFVDKRKVTQKTKIKKKTGSPSP